MHIRNSLDWNKTESILVRRCSELRHSHDIHKLILNIRASVTELSKAEVASRQRRRYRADTLLAAINADIDMVEGFILVAILVG